jgi:Tfp pilus assembly protein PilO
MKLTKRDKKIFALIVILAVGAIAYWGVYQPLAGKWESLNMEIDDYHVKLIKAKRLLDKKEVIKEEYTRYQDKVAVTGSESEVSAALYEKVNQIAKKVGITLDKTQAKGIKQRGPVKLISIFIDFNTKNLGLLERFLNGISESEWIMKVEDLKILSGARDKNKGITVKITISRAVIGNIEILEPKAPESSEETTGDQVQEEVPNDINRETSY